MDQTFHRIKRLPPYVFTEVNAMKARARAAGEDVIDFGMGNPDTPTPQHVVNKLVETVADPRTHRYSASRGIELRRANAAYYARRFGVDIDPELETIATLGSKEGFANLAQAISAPGGVIVVPNPSYPIHAYGFIIAGAALRHVPVGPNVEFMAELERAVKYSVPPPLALVLNFFRPIRRQWSSIWSSTSGWSHSARSTTLSSFQIWPMRRFISTEIRLHRYCRFPVRATLPWSSSLSKTYSMPGWRMGFATGNAKIIAALARIKSYLDYGAFTPIQVAATAALNGPQDCVDGVRGVYQRRRDVLVEAFGQAGWMCRHLPRRCSPGLRFQNRLPILAPWNFPNYCWQRRRLRYLPGSASASTAMVLSGSAWSRTGSGSGKQRET